MKKLTPAQARMLERLKNTKVVATKEEAGKCMWNEIVKNKETGTIHLSKNWQGKSASKTVDVLSRLGLITVVECRVGAVLTGWDITIVEGKE